jgi:K+-transporting ATPase ATPase C chain
MTDLIFVAVTVAFFAVAWAYARGCERLSRDRQGSDPHLSPAAALWQLPRVARARNVAPERVQSVLEEQVEGRDLGILGEPTVNVLVLNLALDRQFGRPSAAGPAASSR